MGSKRYAWLFVLLTACGGGIGGDGGGDFGDGTDATDSADGTDDSDAPDDGCAPLTCEQLGASCGDYDDGCGGTRFCGGCPVGAACGVRGNPQVCAIPEAERECRDGWCWEAPAPSPYRPTAMFALSATDAWSVGTGGAIVHYDGERWTRVASPSRANLHGIYMASPTDGWVVGDGGTTMRWNGTAWTVVNAGAGAANLRGVHGTSANDVWIVGESASRRWNGSVWTAAAVTTPPLEKVITLAGQPVFAIGDGRVWRHGAGAWTAVTPDDQALTIYVLNGLVGSGSTIYASGYSSSLGDIEDLVYRFEGTEWVRIDLNDDPLLVSSILVAGRYYAVHNTGDLIPMDTGADVPAVPEAIAVGVGAGDDLLATGGSGSPVRLRAGVWDHPSFGSYASLHSGAALGDTVWFGGRGYVLEWSNGFVKHDVPTQDPIVAIAGTSPDDVYIMDFEDPFWTGVIAHWDGTTWTELDSPSLTALHVLDVHAGTVLVAGEAIYTLVDDRFTQDTTAPTEVEWRGGSRLGESLYLAGSSVSNPPVARIVRRDGGVYTELPAPEMPVACGIHALADNDIWVAGYTPEDVFDDIPAAGKVAHWNGSSWTVEDVPNATELCTILATPAEILATGPVTGASGIFRRADNAWSRLPISLGALPALVPTATGLWAAGEHGAVLHRAN